MVVAEEEGDKEMSIWKEIFTLGKENQVTHKLV